MIYVNLIKYNKENHSIVFNYTLESLAIVSNIKIIYNSVTHIITPLSLNQPNLTTNQFYSILQTGNFSVFLEVFSISEFTDLFEIEITFSDEQKVKYTIGNLAKYESCLAELISKSKIIDCNLVNNNLCKTFEDKCKNNIYYISTLLASLYRAIECQMISEYKVILEKIKENLSCCCDCEANCDTIYIKNNKYAPYHYFDNEPEINLEEVCNYPVTEINNNLIGNHYDLVLLNLEEEEVDIENINNNTIYIDTSCEIQINNNLIGNYYNLVLLNLAEEQVPIESINNNTIYIDNSCENVDFTANNQEISSIPSGDNYNLEIVNSDQELVGSYNELTSQWIVDAWVRPAWQEIPDTENMAFLIWAVFEDEPVNMLYLNVVANMIVDWGDGSALETGGPVLTKSYDYNSLSSTVFVSHDGRNYKTVLVSINPDGNLVETLHVHSLPSTNIYPNNLLELEDRLISSTGAKNYRISYTQGTSLRNVSAKYAERISLIDKCNSVMQGGFSMLSRCQVFSIPSNFFIPSLTGFENVFAFSFLNINTLNFNFSNLNTSFALSNTSIKKIVTLLGGSNHTSILKNSEIENITNIESTYSSNLSFAFEDTKKLKKILNIDVPNVTDISYMFQRSSVSEIYFAENSCQNITNTFLAFSQCPNIRKIVMPGLTYSVDLSDKCMQAEDINIFLSSLGIADLLVDAEFRTINLSKNPGSSTCDTTIGTDKNFIIIT